jgi:YVTN family beta-propeller protein
VAINATTNLFYVTNEDSNTVSAFDGATDELTTTITVGRNPNGTAVNALMNTVYVASYGSGSRSIIDGATNHHLCPDRGVGSGRRSIRLS